MEINVTNFFKALRENTVLGDLVGEYQGFPAIAEEFPSTPEGIFITLCDQDIRYQYCASSDKAISGSIDFLLRIVGTMKTSRVEMRCIREAVMKELRLFNTNCVATIRIDSASNNMIDPVSERPFAVINARAYFR